MSQSSEGDSGFPLMSSGMSVSVLSVLFSFFLFLSLALFPYPPLP